MPWTIDSPPNPAKNKSIREKRACVAAANAVIKNDPKDEEGAIRACLGAMKKVKSKGDRQMSHLLLIAEREKDLQLLIDNQRKANKHSAFLRSSGRNNIPSLLDPDKDVARFVNKEESAQKLHGAGKTGVVTELKSLGEFGLVIEEGFWTNYVGPFSDEMSARESATEIIEKFALVGTQIFIVQDVVVLRKDFDTSEDGNGD